MIRLVRVYCSANAIRLVRVYGSANAMVLYAQWAFEFQKMCIILIVCSIWFSSVFA